MKKRQLALTAATAIAMSLSLPALAAMGGMKNPEAAKHALEAAAKHGGMLFAKDSFGGHRKIAGAAVTCQTCHLGGGLVAGRLPNGKKIPSLVNAAAIFPRFNPMAHKVVTLGGQIQHCIAGGLGGHPPALGSKPLVDMEAYLASIAHGQSMDAGGKPK